MTQEHNHRMAEGCDENFCTADRYVDEVQVFTDRTLQPERDSGGELHFNELMAKANGKQQTGIVDEVIDRRRQVYGEPKDGFPRIAQVWSGILGHEVTAFDVPLMLIGLKAVRTQITPDYSDNSDDIEGFLAIFRELVGEDMVHARLVSEYIEKKYGDGPASR